jgi:hemoglobin
MRSFSIFCCQVALVMTLATPAFAAVDDEVNIRFDECAQQSAKATIGQGAALFNHGDHDGCYRLYEGSLLAIRTMLGHRVELQSEIDDQLKESRSARTSGAKAYALRAALDAVVKRCGGPAAKMPLWDRLGGEPAVRAVVQEFLRTAAADKKVNVDRNGNYPLTEERAQRIEQLVVEFVSSVTGGPLKYAGRDMKNSHAGMKITEEEFNAAAGHLVSALKKYEVPEAEINELVGLVAGTAKDIIEVPNAEAKRPVQAPISK